jgi:hypothetical protein
MQSTLSHFDLHEPQALQEMQPCAVMEAEFSKERTLHVLPRVLKREADIGNS